MHRRFRCLTLIDMRRYDFNKGNGSIALQLFNANFDKATTDWLMAEMKENRERKIAQRKVGPQDCLCHACPRSANPHAGLPHFFLCSCSLLSVRLHKFRWH